MSKYILSCCSTVDLTYDHLNGRNILINYFKYQLDGIEYKDDFGKSIPLNEFYKKMTEGADTKTSQINASEFVEAFEPILQEGNDILHVTLSSGISGVYNSAKIAQEELAEKYPDRKIYVVDSLCASAGYGLFIDKLADLRDEGMSIEDLYQWAEKNKGRLQHWFFTSDLTFFIKGGRVSKTAGFIGGLMNICPLLNVNSEGKLIPRTKVRTKKKVIQAIVQKMGELVENGSDYSDKCYISNSACLDDAKAVAALVEEKYPKLNGKVLINDIGTTIGSHTGPGTVALFYWGKERDL